MVNFLMYIDANYLYKALICYKSLTDTYKEHFNMYIYCFDDIVYDILQKINYNNVILIKKQDFETKELLQQKSKKKSYEYFWTYTPKLIGDTLKKVPENDIVIYVDADMMFFSSPKPIIDELENKDVLVQPNNFSVKERWQFEPVGYYCVAFNVFRNNANSRKIVSNWKKQCAEWCYANFEQGRFGDQKYLDDWRDKYKKVREVTVVGSNIAPWNIHKFDVSSKDNQVMLNNVPLVFYHFHAFKMNFLTFDYMIEGDRNNHYEIRKDAINNIYKPYIKEAKKWIKYLLKFKEFKKYAEKNREGNVGWYGNE